MAKSGHSSAVQTSSGRVAASRLRCHETNTPSMATGASVIPMRASPTITNSWILASLTGLLAFACFGVTGSRAARRSSPTDRDPVFPRSSDRCERRAFRAGVEPRFVWLRGSRGHDQYRQRIGGRDCARRQRRQRFCTGRHQRADPLSRQSQARRRSKRCSYCSTKRPTPSSRARAAVSTRSPTSKARLSASPKETFRSGFGRRWRSKTESRSLA